MATCVVRRWSIDSAVEPYNIGVRAAILPRVAALFSPFGPRLSFILPLRGFLPNHLAPCGILFCRSPRSSTPPRSVGSCPSAPEPTGVSPPDFRYADCRGFLESVCDAIFLAYDRFFIYFCAPDSGRVRMRSFSAPNGKMKDLKISCLMKKLLWQPLLWLR